MKTDKWAVSLTYDNAEQPEDRVRSITKYLEKQYGITHWVLSDLDATGPLGDKFTQRLNEGKALHLSSAQLLDLLRDDGQVIELTATAVKDGADLFRIIIRDGRSIDVLGKSEHFPRSILGDHYNQDVAKFMW